MKIIPVIDLMGGRVVHAREGRRERYRPLETKLCTGSDPQIVAAALLDLYPFGTLYVADLDAIQGRGDHLQTLGRIRRHFPHLDLWVDSGIGDKNALARWIRADIGRPVIGSESLKDADFLEWAHEQGEDVLPVLSLDFVGKAFKGPASLLAAPARYWPRRVLAMNLRRVGSGAGPDLGLIAKLRTLRPDCAVYAAGGVRSRDDLLAIAEAGGVGALVATAIHDGRLGRAELAGVQDLQRRQ